MVKAPKKQKENKWGELNGDRMNQFKEAILWVREHPRNIVQVNCFNEEEFTSLSAYYDEKFPSEHRRQIEIRKVF